MDIALIRSLQPNIWLPRLRVCLQLTVPTLSSVPPPPSPEVVQDSVEGEAVGPAGGEVQHVDFGVEACALSDPAQKDLLTVGLLKVGHDVLHDIFYLQVHTQGTSERMN